jgi:predicted alpha/beta superfamily hydrolase
VVSRASVPGEPEGRGNEPAISRLTTPDVIHISDFESPTLEGQRQVVVALPPEAVRAGKRFPVVYMHDGQNLFDPATSYAGDWGVGGTLEHHARRGRYAIVVAVYNGRERRQFEYSPFDDVVHGGGGGDRYLRMLIDELKPRIDAEFPTLPGREFTAIAGSSLGGLLSLCALFSRPETFGAAGVLSPSLWVAGNAVLEYIRHAPAVGGRIYLDIGTEEGPNQLANARKLRDLLVSRGYRLDDTLRYLEDEGADHNESWWGPRLKAALPFLLGA